VINVSGLLKPQRHCFEVLMLAQTLVPSQVGGMTCSACCAAVESALDAVPGVTNAVLSLVQQQARVEYHPNVITPVSAPCKFNFWDLRMAPPPQDAQMHTDAPPSMFSCVALSGMA